MLPFGLRHALAPDLGDLPYDPNLVVPYIRTIVADLGRHLAHKHDVTRRRGLRGRARPVLVAEDAPPPAARNAFGPVPAVLASALGDHGLGPALVLSLDLGYSVTAVAAGSNNDVIDVGVPAGRLVRGDGGGVALASGRCERKSSRGQRRADSADVSRLDRNSRASLAKARGELLRILQITFDGAEDVIGLGKQRFGSRYRGGQHLELGQRGRLRR